MATSLMIMGTASNAGKSLLTAGLCRVFKRAGYKVAPFKSQNMALNSFIDINGLELARAQVMQAEACEIVPDVRMNPILLKPSGDNMSDVTVNGHFIDKMPARDYFAYKKKLKNPIMESFNSLCNEYDIVVIEGAGSPAEINLKDGDIVNMGMAKMAQAPVLLAGDIDRGGVFASLAGTMLLLDDDEKKMVKGFIINKFRGDVELLKPGLKMLEDITHIPTLGIVPYLDIKIDDEDSLCPAYGAGAQHFMGQSLIDVGVIKLPRMTNFTDFNPFAYLSGVSLRYIDSATNFIPPDLLIIPGTKNPQSDLKWLRSSKLDDKIKAYAQSAKPLIAIRDGASLLGSRLSEQYILDENLDSEALSIIQPNINYAQSSGASSVNIALDSVEGPLASLSGCCCEGYGTKLPSGLNAVYLAAYGNVYISSLHGLFDKASVMEKLMESLCKIKGCDLKQFDFIDVKNFKLSQYDILADSLEKNLDMDYIYKIMQIK